MVEDIVIENLLSFPPGDNHVAPEADPNPHHATAHDEINTPPDAASEIRTIDAIRNRHGYLKGYKDAVRSEYDLWINALVSERNALGEDQIYSEEYDALTKEIQALMMAESKLNMKQIAAGLKQHNAPAEDDKNHSLHTADHAKIHTSAIIIDPRHLATIANIKSVLSKAGIGGASEAGPNGSTVGLGIDPRQLATLSEIKFVLKRAGLSGASEAGFNGSTVAVQNIGTRQDIGQAATLYA